MLVGHVDDVQVRAVTDTGAAPPDLKLAVIDPGPGDAAPRPQAPPAIDTSDLATAALGAARQPRPATPQPATAADTAALAAAVTAKPHDLLARPVGRRREDARQVARCTTATCTPASCTTRSTPTTTPRAEVPAIIRSIYAYHAQSRGWSDIGYNFLVDRFGRIWEGRYGGVDRPVVGAHTLRLQRRRRSRCRRSATTRSPSPPPAMLDAYGAAVRLEARPARRRRRLHRTSG